MTENNTIVVDQNKTDNQKKNRMKTIKTVIRFGVGGLVEIFFGAVTKSVINRVDGSKIAKIGAKVGGALTGIYVGNKVADYICNEIDETEREIEEFKAALEEGE